MYYNHSSMHKVHLVNGHAVYVYWIDTAYVQNNLPTEFSKKDNFRNLTKNTLKCNISWLMGYEQEAYLYSLFHYTGKKIVKREHQKSKCQCSGSPRRHILGCGISFPVESQLAFHIYYEKYENTLTCKKD